MRDKLQKDRLDSLFGLSLVLSEHLLIDEHRVCLDIHLTTLVVAIVGGRLDVQHLTRILAASITSKHIQLNIYEITLH